MKYEMKYTLEVEKDDKVFSLIMPANAGIATMYQVTYEMLCVLKNNLDDYDKKIREAKEKEEKQPETEDNKKDKTD